MDSYSFSVAFKGEPTCSRCHLPVDTDKGSYLMISFLGALRIFHADPRTPQTDCWNEHCHANHASGHPAHHQPKQVDRHQLQQQGGE